MKIENIKFKAKRLDNREWVEGDLKHSTSYIGIGYPSSAFPDVPVYTESIHLPSASSQD